MLGWLNWKWLGAPPSKEEIFFRAFRPNGNGCWSCLRAAELEGPNGLIVVAPGVLITPGMKFMGLELAHWLDAQAKKRRRWKR
jgi:hypothetical protein